ncbi:MAG: LCP family protein [Coriobacteriia bacterium]|nr:LCP family protein [Coriobacteriia bacterium]MBN2823379.1 LCP family protein [Coriobacteriia bacterium]
MRIHQERRKQRIKRVAYVTLAVFAVVVLGGAAWGYYTYKDIEKSMQSGAANNAMTQEALTEAAPQEPFNILLMGSDIREGEEAARADTIIVARVDPELKKVWMLSIPRDTRVEIPGHGISKINAANYYGGAEGGPALMIETVEGFLDIEINHYMEIDFTGFQAAVDALGGVWIDVDVEIDDWKAASHSPGHAASHIDPGYQLLDGEYALTYVRSRDFADADFTRMRHQQTFFKALAEQSAKIENLPKLPSIARSISGYMSTSMGVGEILEVIQALKGIGGDDVQTATIAGEWKSPYVWTDESEKARLLKAFNDGGSFDASAAADSVLDPADISVTVRNGAGLSGVAAECSGILESRGYIISEVGNANQFVYDRTLVVYDGDDKAAAERVAVDLPNVDIVASRGMYSFTSRILVVVGKDWAEKTDVTTVPSS